MTQRSRFAAQIRSLDAMESGGVVSLSFNLDSSVGRVRVWVCRVVWQGSGVVALQRVRIRHTPCGCAMTRVAAPRKEEQRSRCHLRWLTNPAYPLRVQRGQTARQARNRARSGLTQLVSMIEGTNACVHEAFRWLRSGQQRNQGSTDSSRIPLSMHPGYKGCLAPHKADV
jgi:hypothetical protein